MRITLSCLCLQPWRLRAKQEEAVKQTEKQTLNSPQKHHIYFQLDRSDGQFFKAMEWRWLFFSNDGMAMVFENSHHHHRWFLAGSTIGSDGFSMVFPILGTNGSQWLLEGAFNNVFFPHKKKKSRENAL